MPKDNTLLELAERCEAAEPCGQPFGDGYIVTADGEVWSSMTGRWKRLSPTLTAKGYAKLSLRVNGETRTLRVNRVVAEAYHGPAPFPEAVARHLNDDKANNGQANIAWGTPSDNAHDAVRNGTSPAPENGRKGAVKTRGELNYQAKLTETDVREIRQLLRENLPARVIARRFGVDRSNVSAIKCGKSWGHVQ